MELRGSVVDVSSEALSYGVYQRRMNDETAFGPGSRAAEAMWAERFGVEVVPTREPDREEAWEAAGH